MKEIHVTKAQYIDKYKLQISFSNKLQKVIDFEIFLKNAANPMTRKYLDLKRFKRFRIYYGDLIWGDYEMCFPTWDLYKGNI